MAKKESNLDRQVEELEVLKSIFGPDVQDLRGNSSKPLDIKILLTPLKGSIPGDDQIFVKTTLHITCSRKYPKIIPKIDLEDTQGIPESVINEYLAELSTQAEALKGEVMIFDLSQSVQAFLHKHNKPRFQGSFYDEMLEERRKREKEELTIQMQKQSLLRQNLLDEVEKRKEIFKNEAKRRDTRRSISENSSRNRQSSSSESSFSENSTPFHGHIYPNKCNEHKSSEKLYFMKNGRQIERGSCLGHSQKGCIAYCGIDMDSGQLLYITEWNIKYHQIETKCPANCYWLGNSNCNGHKIDEFIASVEKHIFNLSQLNHKNLIQYECVLCLKRRDGILIWLVQDFVLGTNLSSISTSLGWCTDGSRMVAKGILEALLFLHNKGISHSNLFDSTVFLDNSGSIRCTDFSLVPHLLELIGGQKSNQGDLPALGFLLENLMHALPQEIKEFSDKCKSSRTLSASELLDHPFLRGLVAQDDKNFFNKTEQNNVIDVRKTSLKKPQFTAGIQSFNPDRSIPFYSTISISHCRLNNEFLVLKYLGKGAFGDVLKARNNLDNREYAIKRIPLPARSKQLYKKMTREVELLSRLNHENVVRYFNSWIENATPAELEEIDKNLRSDSSSSQGSFKPLSPCPAQVIESEEDSSSGLWKGYAANMGDSDSDDGIEFIDSKGQIANYESNSNGEESRQSNSPKPLIQVMYIQMEFCEKFTLRLAIDNNLYNDTERLWRFFREIAEGLSHIHQQGIIHRDLKPVNIFLDSRDQIKIGDFGLATTSFLALQSHEVNISVAIKDDAAGTGTGTGKVGTTLYVAPELTGNASKSTYNQKVDMYTLGIILFEMSNPPFETTMERITTIINLRNPTICIPDPMLKNVKYEKNVEIIRWLLDHDSHRRPTAEELLASDLVPPAQLEAGELQEMSKYILANPQSKAYKYLVARCLQQKSDEVLELTYHMGLASYNPVLEFAKSKVINLFRKHGAFEVNTPLLSPLCKKMYAYNNPVCLMTHSGSVVILPNDLRVPFAHYVVMSGKNIIRRYSCDRIYREKKVFNFHPKQNYECAFDVITPHPVNHHILEAELLSIMYEITTEIPKIKEKNISIRMTHKNLVLAILMYCNIPEKHYADLFANIMDHMEEKVSKFYVIGFLTRVIGKSKSSAHSAYELLTIEFPLGGSHGSMYSAALKTLMRGKCKAASLAKAAVKELESVVAFAQSLGVSCPINVYPGLPISFDRASGVIWQMLGDLKSNRSSRLTVLAVGERYDTILSEYQKQGPGCNVAIPHRSLSGAGFSFSLDKIAAAIGTEIDDNNTTINVVVCVLGLRPPLEDAAYIVRLLRGAGIRTSVIETIGSEEAQEVAKELGAMHVILLGESGDLRIRSWDNGNLQERQVTRTELVDYIQKLFVPDSNQNSAGSDSYNVSGNISSSSSSISTFKNNINHLPNIEVLFQTHEKLTANYRKRIENQVMQQMTTTLLQFGRKEHFIVMVVDLTSNMINAIVGAINPREILEKETENEICYVIERFPKHKRYITEIVDEVIKIIKMNKRNTPIVSLYSLSNSVFRIII